MEVFKTNFFASGVLMNEGNNSFRFIPFPDKAQFSTINDMVIDDIDNDGIKDIWFVVTLMMLQLSWACMMQHQPLLLKGTGKEILLQYRQPKTD
ncbi:MAG: hypothetical protein IPI88_08810 [Chitinophagaceae bacterium]|nr:hypothetical protein [Chitinophagaceae bacterium]